MSAIEPVRPCFTLPLSWSFSADPSAPLKLKTIPLPNGKTFVTLGDVPAWMGVDELAAQLRALNPRGVVVKGCDEALAAALGGERLLLSHAANLNLDGFKLASKVRNMTRRSAKRLEVAEVPVGAEQAALFAHVDGARHGPHNTRVEHVYRTAFQDAQRAFVAREKRGQASFPSDAERASAEDSAEKTPVPLSPWMGAITLTRYGHGRWHVEQLARHPSAPPGTMEMLLSGAVEQLKSEGAASLNLGEVPLVFPDPSAPLPFFNRVLRAVAPWLTRFAAKHFDVQGLFRFKDKFEPAWEPRWFVGTTSLSLWDVLCVLRACGVFSLLR